MNEKQLKQEHEAAIKAAQSWDERTKWSRRSCISDQEHSTELWRKVKNIDWQLAELARNNPTTGASE